VCRTIQINGKQHYLWRAADQDGEVVDVYLQARRDGAAAKQFFKRMLRSHGGEPRKIATDKLRSYPVAHREVIPEAIHVADQYANNPAELLQLATPGVLDAKLSRSLRHVPNFSQRLVNFCLIIEQAGRKAGIALTVRRTTHDDAFLMHALYNLAGLYTGYVKTHQP
jgi:hypothetical protein